MKNSVALLSGKGGSGKTSLALILGSLLSACEIRTLVVDCDLGTNGATYFFEEQLSEKYASVVEIINSQYEKCHRDYTNVIKVNEYYAFFPSATIISKPKEYSYLNADDIGKLNETLKMMSDNFDFVIYDLQAGYSEIMGAVLPLVDTLLFIVETDAISSASLRSLYLKIGHEIEGKKAYQIFNKATEEEYKTFSKLISGTLFTNLATIRFDWEIRKAFSLGRVPEIEQCNEYFITVLFEIAEQICSMDTVSERFIEYKEKLKEEKKAQREKWLKDYEQRKMIKDRARKSKYFMSMSISVMGMTATIVSILGLGKMDLSYDNKTLLLVGLVLLSIVIMYTVGFMIFWEHGLFKKRDTTVDELEDQLQYMIYQEEK